MLNIEKTLKNLKTIKELSKDASEIDDRIGIRVLKDIRTQVHDNLKRSIDRIIGFGLKEASLNQTTEKNILVHSKDTLLPRKVDAIHKIQQITILDTIPYQMMMNGETNIDIFDNEKTRLTYLDEFKGRIKILLKNVQEGNLDDQLKRPSEEIIHDIIGRYGKLLPRLDINPNKGRTIGYFHMLISRARKVDFDRARV